MNTYQFTGHVLSQEDATDLCLLVNRYTGEATSRILGFTDPEPGLVVSDTICGTIGEEIRAELTQFYNESTCDWIMITNGRGDFVFEIPEKVHRDLFNSPQSWEDDQADQDYNQQVLDSEPMGFRPGCMPQGSQYHDHLCSCPGCNGDELF